MPGIVCRATLLRSVVSLWHRLENFHPTKQNGRRPSNDATICGYGDAIETSKRNQQSGLHTMVLLPLIKMRQPISVLPSKYRFYPARVYDSSMSFDLDLIITPGICNRFVRRTIGSRNLKLFSLDHDGNPYDEGPYLRRKDRMDWRSHVRHVQGER
jgi:hypothetical protein